MRKSTNMRQWLLAGTSLLLLGLIASSCSSDSSSGTANNCSLGRNACQFGCSADLGCVDCLANADCGSGSPVCVLGRCVACGTNADCGTGQVCSPATHQCTTGCQSDANCSGTGMGNNNTPLCDTAIGACVGCLTTSDCANNPARPVCDSTRRQCSECASSANCGIATPACNLQTGNCEECLVDAHCQLDEACGANHQCIPLCTSNASCNNINGGPVCNVATGACVECTANTDCTDNPAAPVCSTQNRCVACVANADCPSTTPLCETNVTGVGQGQFGGARCVACITATDCTNTALPTCNNQGVCVAGN